MGKIESGEELWSEQKHNEDWKKIREEVKKVEKKLLEEGYKFTLKENDTDYEICIDGIDDTFHITKMPTIQKVVEGNVKSITLAEAIEERIRTETEPQ